MRFSRLPAFKRYYKTLSVGRQERINAAIERLAQALESRQLTTGLGLKQLRHSFWEIRAGLADRVVFRRIRDEIEFVACGSHEDIKRFLRHL